LEQRIPFTPDLAWLYLSLFLLIPAGPLRIHVPGELRRYSLGVGLLGLVSNLCFMLVPTQVPRPCCPHSATWLYRVVVAVDCPTHACPSLHASLAVFSALWLNRVLGGLGCSRLGPIAVWLWALAILYATLAIRQHVLIDLVAGGTVGCSTFLALRLIEWEQVHWSSTGRGRTDWCATTVSPGPMR
jgi:hypothetical protein